MLDFQFAVHLIFLLLEVIFIFVFFYISLESNGGGLVMVVIHAIRLPFFP
jgi:hypothetical protein